MKEFDFSYQVKMSARRKTLSITVHPDNRVIVHAPATCPRVSIARFLEQKSDWIRKALQTNLQRGRRVREKRFETGETLLYLGKEYSLRVEQANQPEVVLTDEHICVRLCAKDAQAGKAPSKVKELLMEWYVSRAMTEVREKIALYSARIGVSPRQITIKSLKSRWGSCSVSGRISLAWNIIMAPESVVDYLIVHELCHMVHHDHSAPYWSLVRTILPDHLQRRKWLRENGSHLWL
ncbi:MAG: SprT family zinc-dependent metalloprotease [Syntrophobacteraceae bacterium]|nr:SprT family zinc-dependent metalloprotease [Syntrophobacteraceae bacterium]